MHGPRCIMHLIVPFHHPSLQVIAGVAGHPLLQSVFDLIMTRAGELQLNDPHMVHHHTGPGEPTQRVF